MFVTNTIGIAIIALNVGGICFLIATGITVLIKNARAARQKKKITTPYVVQEETESKTKKHMDDSLFGKEDDMLDDLNLDDFDDLNLDDFD